MQKLNLMLRHMKIKTSLDWANIETTLRKQVRTKIRISSNRVQINRMIDNLGKVITELSKEEVLERRGHSNNVLKLLAQIEEDIDSIEEFIIIAALIQ